MIKRAWNFLRKWWPSVVTAVLAIGASIFLVCWGLEGMRSYNPRPRDEIIRNYGLLIAAFWGAFLAVSRSQIASQQVETALRQAKTSERSLSDGRFQKGADMLGNQDSATRMGGIYTLEHLAKDHSDGYYRDQVIKLLAAFVRHPVRDDELEERIQEAIAQSGASGRRFREDVSESVCIIGDLNCNKVPADAKPDLSHANLENMYFRGMDFGGINFWSARLKGLSLSDCNLTEAMILDCNLSNARLTKCDLTDATLAQCNLTDTSLIKCVFTNTIIAHSDCTGSNFTFSNLADVKLGNPNISGANFREAKGLSQEQLDRACQKPGTRPPNIPSGLNWDEDAAMERWRDWQE